MTTISAIFTPRAPQPIGPYNQAIEAGPLVFISGQLPLDPTTGELAGSTIQEQARQALHNLKQVLSAAGLSTATLVKVTVFILRMADFGAFNEVYEKELAGARPARSVVGVAALPRGALLEIEAIACR
jgi:2-iminobutanoate/2-iminopropanoate deaminase